MRTAKVIQNEEELCTLASLTDQVREFIDFQNPEKRQSYLTKYQNLVEQRWHSTENAVPCEVTMLCLDDDSSISHGVRFGSSQIVGHYRNHFFVQEGHFIHPNRWPQGYILVYNHLTKRGYGSFLLDSMYNFLQSYGVTDMQIAIGHASMLDIARRQNFQLRDGLWHKR